MPAPSNTRPIIIKRVTEAGAHGHHGGAWKVAYADFVTAMMAFFLLLWLVGSADKDTLKGLAEFFSDAKVNVGPPGGTGGILEGFSLTPEHPAVAPTAPIADTGGDAPLQIAPVIVPLPVEATSEGGAPSLPEEADPLGLEAAEAEIRAALAAVPELARLRDSLLIDETEEGLRIQLVDRDQLAMFPVGSDAMYAHTRRLIEVVVDAIAQAPGKVSIRGHTDALPFLPGAEQDNWSLSSDRANATRRAMIEAGLDPARIADVIGKADVEPLLPDRPHDPRNRRISIVLLHGRSAAPQPMALPAATGAQHEEPSSKAVGRPGSAH